MPPTRWRVAVVVPCAALSLGLAGSSASAAPAVPHPATPFCSQSVTLVKDLLGFGKLPRTNSAITSALTRVDRELQALGAVAPTRQDKATVAMLRAEFAHLKTIVVTDPFGTRAADASFVRGFSTTAARQGLALGVEIKAACSR